MEPNGFSAPWYLRNGHVQSLLASVGPRKLATRYAARRVEGVAEKIILKTPGGVRLEGFYSRSGEARPLVTLIHGWEGTARSAYVLSAASYLHGRGYDIFRLHLRDHGDTHHLNAEPFSADKIEEVSEALARIHEEVTPASHYLAGYSLGGNIALRAAAHEKAPPFSLVVGVCPVIDPARSTRDLSGGSFVYRSYFMKKWSRSLRAKERLFPSSKLRAALDATKDLWELHEKVIPLYTPFPDAESYFNSYALNPDSLAGIEGRARIIATRDDPVLKHDYLEEAGSLGGVDVELVEHGGHCGFIEGFDLSCWLDRRLVELFQERRG